MSVTLSVPFTTEFDLTFSIFCKLVKNSIFFSSVKSIPTEFFLPTKIFSGLLI